MALDTYTNLRTAIGEHLNRTDLSATDAITADLITLAEAKLAREPRIRYVINAAISVSADEYSLPSGFRELISLYHDGATYFGPINICSPDQIGAHKSMVGDSGIPQWAAIVGTANPFLRFAPEPNQSIDLKLIYSSGIRGNELSDSNTTNWLLDRAPDIYLYAALAEAEAYLQEDQRIAVWKGLLEEALQQYHIDQQRKEYGGTLSRFPARGIGSDV
jgi:hypothetical protein